MLAYLLSGALALSCSSAPEESPQGRCDAYRADTRAHGICLLEERGLSGEVESTCGDLGVVEGHCRLEWVRTRLPQEATYSVADLNAACGGEGECLLFVASRRMRGTVLDQAETCLALPEDVQDDCVHHVLLPWVNGSPTSEEVAALQRLDLPAFHVGPYLAMVVHCLNIGACPDEGDLAVQCASSVLSYRTKPDVCAGIRAKRNIGLRPKYE